ncbi:MAG TPA: IPT/TIG domain-containing protein, partial [Acidimicrobiales bacterium]
MRNSWVTRTENHTAGVESSGHPFWINSPASVVAGLTPNSAVAGTPGQPITIFGANFVPTSVVLLDGTRIDHGFISPHELKAFIPAEALVYPRTAVIMVVTPP